MQKPQHIAIIMDGNGRWARAKGRDRLYGHIKGARVARQTIEECAKLGISYLTLFTFSSENWQRPQREVAFLMGLLAHHLRRQRKFLLENNIKFTCIGDLSPIPARVLAEVKETIRATEKNTGMVLTFALSYGGRQEILRATQELAKSVRAGELLPENITEEMFSSRLESHNLPDPDLIIRTSGESRLSNFMLWQAAYSELFFVSEFWPEFNSETLHKAIAYFNTRQRRFGRISDKSESNVDLSHEQPRS